MSRIKMSSTDKTGQIPGAKKTKEVEGHADNRDKKIFQAIKSVYIRT